MELKPLDEKQNRNWRKTVHDILSVMLAIILALYLIIMFWGVFFKCNQNDVLLRGYELWQNSSWFDRIFMHDDFVTWLIKAMNGDYINENLRTVALNCILLLPVGLILPYFVKKKNVWRITLYCFILSLVIEIVQLLTFWGAFSIADLVTNTFSGLLGALLFKLIYRPQRERVFLVLSFIITAILLPIAVIAVVRTANDMAFYIDLASKNFL